MAKPSYRDLVAQIESLSKQAAAVREAEKRDVIGRIQEAIDFYGIRAGELRFPKGPKPRSSIGLGAAPKARASKVKASGTARYRDDKGNEWVGRGKRPDWLKAALAAGKSLSDFAV